jgi:hypothetical protein
MTRNQLFKQLNSLCNEMDTSYNINCGGCCFVAATIAEQLERFNIPFTLIHYGKYSCHYAIRVNDRIINRCDYSYKEIFEENITSSDEIYYIYENNYWNDMYNRKWNLIVKTRIKSLFNKYGNRI